MSPGLCPCRMQFEPKQPGVHHLLCFQELKEFPLKWTTQIFLPVGPLLMHSFALRGTLTHQQ